MTDKDMRRVISRGVTDGILVFVVLIVAGSALVAMTAKYTDFGRDDTDGTKERSNLEVLTDCLTGLQYLKSSGGGLTPRLNVAGRHMAGPCS